MRDAAGSPRSRTRAVRRCERRRHALVRRRNGKTSTANATRALNGKPICNMGWRGFTGGCAAASWVGADAGGFGGVAGFGGFGREVLAGSWGFRGGGDAAHRCGAAAVAAV